MSALFGIDVPTCTDNVEVLEATPRLGSRLFQAALANGQGAAAGPLYACLGLSTTTPLAIWQRARCKGRVGDRERGLKLERLPIAGGCR